MADPKHDIGLATRLSAEAIGQPGQRRFRILVETALSVSIIWVEKEQLNSLAVSIARLLQIIDNNYPESRGRTPTPPPAPSATSVTLDFQSGTWALGYIETAHVLEFRAHDVEEGPPLVRFLSTLEQGLALSEEAMEAYSAGRPHCPLCDAPLNEGEDHVCRRGNGHARASVE